MDYSKIKILICDDSILARKQLKDVITEFADGATIIEAANGQEAIDAYKSEHPTLVFLDIVMPKKDGNAAVSEIVEYDDDADIIIVSSVGTQSQLRQAIEAGARDFVQKPIEKSQVRKIVETHCEGR